MSFNTNNGANALGLVYRPRDAAYTSSSSAATGSIRFTLPQSWTNTMMSMHIDVYNYAENSSFTIYCGGYTSSTSGWTRTFASALGDSAAPDNMPIYFGHDGTKCYISVGSTGHVWSYPKLAVTSFQAGHSTTTNSANWSSGWVVSLQTTVPSVTATQYLNFPHADASGALSSPAGAVQGSGLPIWDTTNDIIRVLANVQHDGGHITGVEVAELDFGTGGLEVTTSVITGDVGLKIRADSISSKELTISADVDSQASSIFMSDNGVIKVYDSNGVLRVKIGNLNA